MHMTNAEKKKTGKNAKVWNVPAGCISCSTEIEHSAALKPSSVSVGAKYRLEWKGNVLLTGHMIFKVAGKQKAFSSQSSAFIRCYLYDYSGQRGRH